MKRLKMQQLNAKLYLIKKKERYIMTFLQQYKDPFNKLETTVFVPTNF